MRFVQALPNGIRQSGTSIPNFDASPALPARNSDGDGATLIAGLNRILQQIPQCGLEPRWNDLNQQWVIRSLQLNRNTLAPGLEQPFLNQFHQITSYGRGRIPGTQGQEGTNPPVDPADLGSGGRDPGVVPLSGQFLDGQAQCMERVTNRMGQAPGEVSQLRQMFPAPPLFTFRLQLPQANRHAVESCLQLTNLPGSRHRNPETDFSTAHLLGTAGQVLQRLGQATGHDGRRCKTDDQQQCRSHQAAAQGRMKDVHRFRGRNFNLRHIAFVAENHHHFRSLVIDLEVNDLGHQSRIHGNDPRGFQKGLSVSCCNNVSPHDDLDLFSTERFIVTAMSAVPPNDLMQPFGRRYCLITDHLNRDIVRDKCTVRTFFSIAGRWLLDKTQPFNDLHLACQKVLTD